MLIAPFFSQALDVSLTIQHARCGNDNGSVIANVSGGVQPYAFSWNTGATTPQLTGVGEGTFSVTVTDAMGVIVQETGTVLQIFEMLPIVGVVFQNACNNLCTATGQFTTEALSGVAPYSVDHPMVTPVANGSLLQDLCPGFPTEIPISDVNGCPGSVIFNIVSDPAGSPWILGTTAACGASNGTITLGTMGPGDAWFRVVGGSIDSVYALTDAPYVITGLPSGYYDVAYWDNSNGQVVYCTYSSEAVVGWNLPNLGPQIAATSPACGNEANGTIILEDPGSSQASFNVIGPGIDSIFTFTDPPYVFAGLPTGIYDIVYWNLISNEMLYCSGTSTVEVGSMQDPCGGIMGRVFHDADQDCVYTNGDVPLANRVLTIGPDDIHMITNSAGYFTRALPLGSYTLGQSMDGVAQLCPLGTPIPFSLDNGQPYLVMDIADSSTVPHDIEILLWSSPARPGFATTVTIQARNNSAYPSGVLAIDLQFDPMLTGSTPANGLWILPSLAPFAHETLTFQAMVPPNVNLLGTVLTYTATVINTVTEPDLTNNTVTITRTITGAYDPNDKIGTTNGSESNSSYFLAQDEWIDYTIRFQNTGSDTAFTVVIRDTLDQLLDIPSLDILGASHPFTPSFEEGRTLAFTFNNILLPDSTTDLLGSQGFVSYRIKPVNSIMVGDVIENTAGIYFDFNPPIITNTTSHVVEISTQLAEHERRSIRVYPNPANESLVINMPEGTGLMMVEVFATDGRLLRVTSERSLNRCTLDVSSLTNGAYIVKVQHAEGISTARFVKQ